MKKSDLLKVKAYYEDQYYFKNEFYFQKILKELADYNNEWHEYIESLYGDFEEKFNTVHLQVLENNSDIDFFYSLISKYHYQFIHTLLWFIRDICNTTYSNTETYLIERACRSPYIYSIQSKNETYIVDCILGTIFFQKATRYFSSLNQEILQKLAESRNLADYCHDSTLLVSSFLIHSYAYTSLCTQAFIGQFYHSFTFFNQMCIDLNFNCVIPFEQYVKLLKAYPIQIISSDEARNIYKNHPNQSELFFMALEKQRKRTNGRKLVL